MGKYKLLREILILSVLFSSIEGYTVYDYFKEFCAIGERVPGTKGHTSAQKFILNNLKNALVDSFFQEGVWFYNIYKKFPGGNPLIGIAAHWDSDINCPGANDGGSGVALLLKLADTLEKNPPPMRVDLLFFDGEDVRRAELLGSTHFAKRCLDQYSFIIVIDMVGDKDLKIYKEGHSAKFFPQFVDSIWQIGMGVAPNVFIPDVKYYIIDDHIALIKYGIRAIDVIDFDYPYWDTGDDTIDKCSEKSLEIMYQFLLRIVYGLD
uniref:M28 family peptidase n=1 Tax=candidate division WOR-3 bacterium TaxID=2052148 RepID=A0A7C4XF32_UNCW3